MDTFPQHGCAGTAGADTGASASANLPDSLVGQRVALLRSFRSPRVEQIEERQFLEDYLERRKRVREEAAA